MGIYRNTGRCCLLLLELDVPLFGSTAEKACWQQHSIVKGCKILAWTIFVALLIPQSSGHGKTAFTVHEAHNVTVARGYCYYNYRLFYDTLYSKSLCSRFKCYAARKTVRITSCAPPEPGCHWSHRDDQFPDCCRTECPPPKSICHYRNTTLQSGDSLFSSRPCLSLFCNAGNITIVPCKSE